MNRQLVPLVLLLLFLPSTDSQAATQEPIIVSYRPGGDGDCVGAGNLRRNLLEFSKGRLRSLQTNVISGGNSTWEFDPETDIPICCTGNGDFEFLKQYLQIRGLAEDEENDGFDAIPGDSRWSCRRACRDPANNFTDLEECYASCDCRQECPFSNDCLTQDCKVQCVFDDELAQDLCLTECDRQCGERCRSTLNGYIVPFGIYNEALKILDCFYGDLIGEQESSCAEAKAFWESTGHTCTRTEEFGLDCQCDIPGTCFNEVYPCPYDFHCTSEAPSLVPSTSPSMFPSMVPSKTPSASPSKYPTMSPTPRPTKGKAGKGYAGFFFSNGTRIPGTVWNGTLPSTKAQSSRRYNYTMSSSSKSYNYTASSGKQSKRRRLASPKGA